ncbi:helix-turn-helix domain-containing protein [Geobacter sp. SVR]|uniref:helix-turn-helix domain-containing protein n=1 Tax=Geobacter sp. SVR TaxID=2495594 RepID=UPI00143EFA64|nr:helix-turn-helix transcriptional regulator [Geobacter sp. SVR]BCS53642.1 hypothetical protein GSVR_19500 [Geobacter sp. SVR]GCF84161.1 hypothetical protein GSbR_07610 [Geobacter sp. SVR]
MHNQRIISNCEIGATIRRRRHELALSQEELAAMLNVTTQQIHRYESGKDRISVEKLQIVARSLSVPLTYFFCSDGEDIVPETDSERELLINFRKIQNNVFRDLVMDFLRKALLLELGLYWLVIGGELLQVLPEVM